MDLLQARLPSLSSAPLVHVAFWHFSEVAALLHDVGRWEKSGSLFPARSGLLLTQAV